MPVSTCVIISGVIFDIFSLNLLRSIAYNWAKGKGEVDSKWQGVVASKDAEIANNCQQGRGISQQRCAKYLQRSIPPLDKLYVK
ncbi:MAG: hypothetical protein FWB99_02665 [Treponema sp.]|nr:hypothetical protein [Treponema sp.]